MIRAAVVRAGLCVALILGTSSSAWAQTVESPLIPRGSLFLRMHPSANAVEGTYGPDGGETLPLGQSFAFPSLGSDEVPSLQPTTDRFAALAERPGTRSIRLGATVARFSGDERVLPLQLSYGVLDRLTIGVTVPIIRKRLETLLRLDPEGADVGRNPNITQAGLVSTFLSDANGSLAAVQSAVDATCTQFGGQDAGCLSGRELITGTDSFLMELSAAYQEEDLFPLEGSVLGQGLSGRWTDLVNRFQEWDTAGPIEVPLASEPIDQATFQTLVVDPAWPGGGFPVDRTDALFGMGDVEVNVALGLLRPDPPPAVPVPNREPGLQVHAAAVGTVRFATGSPDSLRTVSPIDPPRGVSGFSLGGVVDLLLPGRFQRVAVLGTVEAGWNGSREITLLVPDPALAFTPGQTQADVRWSPGSHLRASVAPRLRLGPALSVGVGWHFLRREPDVFDTLAGGSGTFPPPPGESYSQHRLGAELRYTSMEPPALAGVPFPFEILFRASWSAAGSEGAPVERRAEAMVRFRLRE